MNRTIFGVNYQTGYEYDLAGEITAIIYPSGTRIEYARDGAARITAVTATQSNSTVTNIASGIGYKPFGPVNAMTLGDGHVLSIDYDANYRATRLLRAKSGLSLMDLDRPCRGLLRLYSVPRTEYFCYGKTVSKAYDPASDITAMNDNVRPERDQGFAPNCECQ